MNLNKVFKLLVFRWSTSAMHAIRKTMQNPTGVFTLVLTKIVSTEPIVYILTLQPLCRYDKVAATTENVKLVFHIISLHEHATTTVLTVYCDLYSCFGTIKSSQTA